MSFQAPQDIASNSRGASDALRATLAESERRSEPFHPQNYAVAQNLNYGGPSTSIGGLDPRPLHVPYHNDQCPEYLEQSQMQDLNSHAFPQDRTELGGVYTEYAQAIQLPARPMLHQQGGPQDSLGALGVAPMSAWDSTLVATNHMDETFDPSNITQQSLIPSGATTEPPLRRSNFDCTTQLLPEQYETLNTIQPCWGTTMISGTSSNDSYGHEIFASEDLQTAQTSASMFEVMPSSNRPEGFGNEDDEVMLTLEPYKGITQGESRDLDGLQTSPQSQIVSQGMDFASNSFRLTADNLLMQN